MDTCMIYTSDRTVIDHAPPQGIKTFQSRWPKQPDDNVEPQPQPHSFTTVATHCFISNDRRAVYHNQRPSCLYIREPTDGSFSTYVTHWPPDLRGQVSHIRSHQPHALLPSSPLTFIPPFIPTYHPFQPFRKHELMLIPQQRAITGRLSDGRDGSAQATRAFGWDADVQEPKLRDFWNDVARDVDRWTTELLEDSPPRVFFPPPKEFSLSRDRGSIPPASLEPVVDERLDDDTLLAMAEHARAHKMPEGLFAFFPRPDVFIWMSSDEIRSRDSFLAAKARRYVDDGQEVVGTYIEDSFDAPRSNSFLFDDSFSSGSDESQTSSANVLDGLDPSWVSSSTDRDLADDEMGTTHSSLGVDARMYKGAVATGAGSSFYTTFSPATLDVTLDNVLEAGRSGSGAIGDSLYEKLLQAAGLDD